MITIRDKCLGKYHLVQDHQGMKVCEEAKTLVKVDNLEQGLRHIAERLTIDSDETLTLIEYTKKRQEIFESIVNAQQEITVEKVEKIDESFLTPAE